MCSYKMEENDEMTRNKSIWVFYFRKSKLRMGSKVSVEVTAFECVLSLVKGDLIVQKIRETVKGGGKKQH